MGGGGGGGVRVLLCVGMKGKRNMATKMRGCRRMQAERGAPAAPYLPQGAACTVCVCVMCVLCASLCAIQTHGGFIIFKLISSGTDYG